MAEVSSKSCYEVSSEFVSQFKSRDNVSLLGSSMLGNIVADFREHSVYQPYDLHYVFALASAFTIVRYLCTSLLITPLVRFLCLTGEQSSKFGESTWKLLFYVTAWSMAARLLLYPAKYSYFYQHAQVFSDHTPGMPIPSDILVVYLVQTAFYVHSIYASVFMDVWRTDSIAMLAHHVVTILLLAGSYAMRFHKIWLIVLVTHDICDLFLESAKLCIYLKNRKNHNNNRQLYDNLSTILFIGFGVSWAVFRLYLYPQRAVLTALCGAPLSESGYSRDLVPTYIFFCSLLTFIFILDVHWFLLILKLAYRMLFAGEGVEDIREDSEEEGDQQDVITNNNKENFETKLRQKPKDQ